MENLTIHQIQRYLNYLYENFTVESAKTRFGLFRSVVKECYRMKEIKENLCDFVKSPKKEASSIADVYTREEILQLFKLLEDKHFELPILLIVLLGLRKGEAYGLTWDDIDFDNAEREHPGIAGKMNATLYHQAGNSMVVDVLEAIFKQIISGG